MKKNTAFYNLFQKIVSEEEIAGIQDTIGYKDSARKLDVLFTLRFFKYRQSSRRQIII